MAKRRVKKSKSRKVVKVSNPIDYHNRRIKLGLKNLVVFALLSLISLALEKVSMDGYPTLFSLFEILKIVFFSLSLAFLIVVIIFLFLKGFRKK